MGVRSWMILLLLLNPKNLYNFLVTMKNYISINFTCLKNDKLKLKD